ncbi:MAG TPA: hypothetical protein VE981_11140 [Planctomycetota bacterium]|nr:hypothetical protein [Planctomycetota bacterium]
MNVVLTLLLLALQSAPEEKPKTPADRDAILRKAEELIEARETPGALEQAIVLLNGLFSDPGPGLPLLIDLARAHALLVDTYDLGKQAEKPRHKEHREAGKIAATRALSIDPQSGPAHYWNGILLLYSSDGEQSYAVLKQSVKELEIADRLSPDYDGAGPARMLGRIYQQTPGWPLLGSNPKAIEYLERARKSAPDNLRNGLWLGLSYETVGKTKPAREQLTFVLASKPHAGHELEEAALKKEAADHLKHLESK